jgi:(N-acetylneuraminyl)-galactosylglucosylceramide N-acetylgalactosaminyltransferase
MENVTCIIKSFRRPKCLEKLYTSIRQFYPKIKIIITDDSGTSPYLTDALSSLIEADSNVKIKELEFDVGLSVGRNAAVDLVETEYFVLLDDDFFFINETKLENFVEAIEKSNCDIIGGMLNEKGFIRGLCTVMQIKDNVLYDVTGARDKVDNVLITDKVYNFFIAKTDVIKNKNRWDENYKLCEHNEFFLRAQQNNIRVGFIDNVIIGHSIARDPDYNTFRSRGVLYLKLTEEKYGYNKWVKRY